MRITDLCDALGVEVHDVDAREPLSTAELDQLRAAYDRRHLLLFRGQELSAAAQLEFVGNFGPLPERSFALGYVSNARPDGILSGGSMRFHSDLAFTEEPLLGISLHALEVPGTGAPTNFANAARAVATMPDRLRERVESRRIVNCYDFQLPDSERMREHAVKPGSPVVERPFVEAHPRTGVPVLNSCEMQTDRVVGMSGDESEALLAEVFALLYASDNVYAHHWEVGDLLVWDNRALQHGRDDFPVAERRTMQRVCLCTKTLHELVPNWAALYA